MFDKLYEIEKNYLQLREQLYDPEISTDTKKSIEIGKKLSELEEVYEIFQHYKKYTSEYNEAKSLMIQETDSDMLDLAKEQLNNAEKMIQDLEAQIKVALLPKDPNDDKNIFLEIRPAAGGDEAGLFGSELMRMYMMYAQKKKWQTDIIEHQYSDIWGLKFVMIKISGHKVYSLLKFESWVHRVQRIPDTEANGRVHTSTVTVAIMPEVDDVDIHIDMNDIVMDTYAASSSGWQNANKNQTWVRLHHNPSGLIVTIGDSKSQLQNKEKAFMVLKARLYQIEIDKKQATSREIRGNQIWQWDRSEKIRTYNFPQDRLTDHRVKLSWSNLPVIMAGEIDDIVQSMVVENQTLLLSSHGNAS